MARYTLKQKIFIVKRYYQNGNSTEKVQIEFPDEFKRCKQPSDGIIIELVNLFEEFGNVSTRKGDFRKNVKIEDVDQNIKLEDEDLENLSEQCLNNEIKNEDEISIAASNYVDNGEDDKFLLEIKPINKTNLSDDSDEESMPLNEVQSKLEKSILVVVDKLEDIDNDADNFYNDDINDMQDTEDETNDEKDDKLSILKLPLTCEICSKVFDRKRSYLKHIEFHKQCCKICGKNFRDYDKHMRKHTGEKAFQCTVCGSQFIDMSRLRSHMTTHSDERPFTCTVCNKSFKSKDRLNGHSKIHLTERPIKCEICGKGFLNNGDLKKHTRVHTGEKPYVCSFCGKRFATGHSLTVHNRIHTGEKPYKCCYCNKQYNVAGSLNIHKRIHTGEKPYKCKYCEKLFYDTATCRVHERTHTGDYPYKCLLCGKAHNHPSNLKSHMRHAHREDQR